MEKNKIVRLATFTSSIRANIVASMLRSMDIEVEVVNEISTNMIPYLNDNNVKLLIKECDYEKARKLLDAEQVKE